MPTPYLKKLSVETGKPISELESIWATAKKEAAEHFSVNEEDMTSKHYAYATGIVKNAVKPKEYVPEFVQSNLSAKEFIETVISGGFTSIHKDGLIVSKDSHKKKVVGKLTPSLQNMETSGEDEPEEGKEMDFEDMGGTAGYSQAGDGGDGGDGGGVGGESTQKRTNILDEDDEHYANSDNEWDFDFLTNTNEGDTK